jgi:hypothetical protein
LLLALSEGTTACGTTRSVSAMKIVQNAGVL